VPTSVLLAVLAAAGLLALAPALVRRYDATERLAAERAQSTARVLDRHRRRRTVPGARPLNPPRVVVPPVTSTVHETVDLRSLGVINIPVSNDSVPLESRPPVGQAVWVPVGRTRVGAGTRPQPVSRQRISIARDNRRPAAPRPPVRPRAKNNVVYRRRRFLIGLLLLNIAEVVLVITIGAVLWPAAAVTGLALAGYLIHLRNAALADARLRRVEARHAVYVSRVQAEIRAEQARRLAVRKEALRRAAAARASAQRDAQRLSQRYTDFDPARRARVRGRQYDTGRVAGL
jgi:hypothetical protein